MQQPILSKVLSDIELRNCSKATKDLYMRTCARHLELIGDRPLAATGESDVRAFSRHLRCDRGPAPKTVNTHLAAALFMYEVGLDRPMSRRRIPFLRKPKAMPKVFSRDGMAAIMAATGNVRHRAQISLGHGAGLRISEVCSLRVRDVDPSAMRLPVEDGKGAKDRHTPLPATTLSLLREYWEAYRPHHPEGWLLLGPYGHTHVTDDAVRYGLSAAMRKAGVEPAGRSFHTLRASFATHLPEDGCGLTTIKSLMGHSSLSSTAAYPHVADMAAGVTSPVDSVMAPAWP